MKVYKGLSWFMILVLGFSFLTGCGVQADKDKDKIVIGAAMPTFDDKWLSYLYDAINKYDQEHKEVEVKMVDAKNDSSKQLAQVETFLAEGVDAIIIIPVDTSAVKPMVDEANDANVPVVIANRMPTPDILKKIYAYVGSESIQSGRMQMEKVAEMLGGKGNVAIMTGELGSESQVKRTQGNEEVIRKHPGMKIVHEGTANYQRADGIKLMENWIESGEKIDAVVANNDEMAIGSIMALEAAGKLNHVIVAGIDGTPDALEYVKAGKLKVTVFQDPVKQGEGAVETAVKAARGEKLGSKFVWVPYELITKENVQKYINKWKQYQKI